MILRPPNYDKLALFSGNLRTCLASGVDLVKSLETCNRVLENTSLEDDVQAALDLVKRGGGLYDSLKPYEAGFPPFYLPVLRAGEMSGRLDESLGYLERHCGMLAGPSKAVRNAWLFPLAAIVFGTLVQLLVFLVTSPLTDTLAFVLSKASQFGLLALLIAALTSRPLRPLVDRVRAAIPFLGSIERDLAYNRFFHVLAVLYAMGSLRVEVMIRVAGQSVSNVFLRQDLRRAASAVESGASVSEAFRAPRELPRSHFELIATGDEAGKLEPVCERISLAAEQDLTSKLKLLNTILFRVTIVVVSLMIIQSMMVIVGRVIANM